MKVLVKIGELFEKYMAIIVLIIVLGQKDTNKIIFYYRNHII